MPAGQSPWRVSVEDPWQSRRVAATPRLAPFRGPADREAPFVVGSRAQRASHARFTWAREPGRGPPGHASTVHGTRPGSTRRVPVAFTTWPSCIPPTGRIGTDGSPGRLDGHQRRDRARHVRELRDRRAGGHRAPGVIVRAPQLLRRRRRIVVLARSAPAPEGDRGRGTRGPYGRRLQASPHRRGGARGSRGGRA